MSKPRTAVRAGSRGETNRARAVATVERVLPWRRQVQTADALQPLLIAFRDRHPKLPTAMIVKAYELAAEAHQGQVRNSGEAYISHPLAVATILAGLGLDDVTIVAALLHDAVEDTSVGLEDIEAEFGPDVAAIVDGVTKLDRVSFDSKQAQQAATMRKMLVAMAKDPRVLLIKLADRLHNMQTIAAMPEWKQKRTAQETLDIYAPAGPPLRDPGHQMAARGPGLRRAAPPPLRGDRADGRDPGARARHLPGPGDRPGQRAAGCGPHRRPGHGAARSTCTPSTRRWS